MFKVNTKDTRTTYFTPCSSVSIVHVEQVNAGWADVQIQAWLNPESPHP